MIYMSKESDGSVVDMMVTFVGLCMVIRGSGPLPIFGVTGDGGGGGGKQ